MACFRLAIFSLVYMQPGCLASPESPSSWPCLAEDDQCSSLHLLQTSSLLSRHPADDTDAEVAAAALAGAPVGPPEFLIISSPSTKKVVYTTLKNMRSSDGRVFPLIDSGLTEPKGLAFDRTRGFLYIADSGAEKIFRYTIVADQGDSGMADSNNVVSAAKPHLKTTFVRTIVVQDCGPVEWVTLDEAGNLFYSAPLTNNINKVSAEVMKKLASGEMKASSLTIVSEKSMEAVQSAEKAIAKKKVMSDDVLPTDPPPVQAHIFQIYEAKLNPHVSQPAAICADGEDLFWTNQADGLTAGTLVQGQVNPVSVATSSDSGPAPFPAVVLTSISSSAQALAKTDKTIFFTRESDTGCVVSGLLLGTDIVVDFATSLVIPRGMAWDKDQTIYVADEGTDQVMSFPTGRMMRNAPLTEAASMAGPFGLAVVRTQDAWFTANKVNG